MGDSIELAVLSWVFTATLLLVVVVGLLVPMARWGCIAAFVGGLFWALARFARAARAA